MGTYLAGLVLVFGLGHDRLLGLIPLFNLDGQGNVPAVYSALLLLCSALLTVIAVASRKRAAWGVPHWFGLAVVFLFLAVDEALSLHERLTEPLRSALNTCGFFHYAWVVPYAAATLLLAAIEEGLEMFGALLFIHALLVYIESELGEPTR